MRVPNFLLLATAFSGCVSPFVYRPPRPPAQAPHFPLNAAVFAFTDGTDDFIETGREHPVYPWVFNLAKGGGAEVGLPRLAPELMTQYFLDDLLASRMFDSAKMRAPSTLNDEDIVIEGSIVRANLSIHGAPSEIAIRFWAISARQKKQIWEGTFSRDRILPLSACASQKCGLQDVNEFLQRIFQEIFAEARQNLAVLLKTLPTPP